MNDPSDIMVVGRTHHKNLFEALAKAQGEVENAKKDTANPFFKSKYADLASVWDAIRAPLSNNGLAIIQLPVDPPAGIHGIRLRTVMTHSSGEAIEESFTMPLKPNAGAQEVGSALTYARRYALMAMVGIAPEDDDGNAATARPTARTPVPQPVIDWAKAAKDQLDVFGISTEATQRGLYAEVRNSSMPEPHKTATLTVMANTIKGKKASNG